MKLEQRRKFIDPTSVWNFGHWTIIARQFVKKGGKKGMKMELELKGSKWQRKGRA